MLIIHTNFYYEGLRKNCIKKKNLFISKQAQYKMFSESVHKVRFGFLTPPTPNSFLRLPKAELETTQKQRL